MTDIRAAIANRLWRAASRPAWLRLRAELRDPASVQEALLHAYVRANQETAFGQRHGFATIRSVRDYRAAVPISSYDDLEPYVQRISRGEPNVLTREPVDRLVPSSGSTSAAKLIPFTAGLRREFSSAVDAWMADLLTTIPSVANGPAYWSITPPVPQTFDVETTIPTGFDEDSRYLGGTRQALARAIFAVPPGVARLQEIESFQYATVLFLLRSCGLRLISVWHPSFLDRLLDTLSTHYSELIEDVRHGTLSPPEAESTSRETIADLSRSLRADPARAAVLRRCRPDDIRAIWPDLSVVSCWADGPSRAPAEHLAKRLGGVPLQPKGLLATEGVVTIPFDGLHPLAIGSHVFEFLDGAGGVRPPHELEPGAEYTVLLTTAGGLYRYRLGDRVRVDGFVERTPSLTFVAREDRVADWFGEKLSEGFVAGVVDRLFDGRAPRFAMLAPERTDLGVAYTLFIDGEGEYPALAQRLESSLRSNPNYAWCVDLGQLRPAQIVHVGADAGRSYVDACVADGQRLGDVKPTTLRGEMGWSQRLPARDSRQETLTC
jgi:GH3 auxin-responsive promoter